MKLISMTDFVLEQLNEENSRVKPMREVFNSLEKYAKFLKQPLNLGMFVPCDENGEIIIERHYEYFDNEIEHSDYLKCLEKAKEKVIFKGFYLFAETSEMVEFREEYMEIILYRNKKYRLKQIYRLIQDLCFFKLDLAVSF